MAKPRALTQPAHEAAGFLVAAAVAVEAGQQRAETLSEPREAIRRPGLECPEIELDPDHGNVPIDVGTAVDARLDYPQPAPRCSSPNHIRSGLRNGRGIAGVHSPALIDWGRRLIESHADARRICVGSVNSPGSKGVPARASSLFVERPSVRFRTMRFEREQYLAAAAYSRRPRVAGSSRRTNALASCTKACRPGRAPSRRSRGAGPRYKGGPDLDQADGRRAVLSPVTRPP